MQIIQQIPNWQEIRNYCNTIKHHAQPEQTKSANQITTLNLTGGELIEFNSKLSHKGTPLDSERIGINLWTARIDLNNPKNWSNNQ